MWEAAAGRGVARESVVAMERAAEAAAEAYRLALLGYRNEVTPMLDVLQAQAELTRARAELEVARLDLQTAKVNALVAMGEIPAPRQAAGRGQ